jgi:hypothetical protein
VHIQSFLKIGAFFLAGNFDLRADFPGRGRESNDTVAEKTAGIERHHFLDDAWQQTSGKDTGVVNQICR